MSSVSRGDSRRFESAGGVEGLERCRGHDVRSTTSDIRGWRNIRRSVELGERAFYWTGVSCGNRSPLLGWKSESAHEAPPTLLPNSPLCDGRPHVSSCNFRSSWPATLVGDFDETTRIVGLSRRVSRRGRARARRDSRQGRTRHHRHRGATCTAFRTTSTPPSSWGLQSGALTPRQGIVKSALSSTNSRR